MPILTFIFKECCVRTHTRKNTSMEQTLEEAKASLRAQAQLPLRKSTSGQASGGGGSQQRVARRLNDEYVVGKKLGTGSYAVVREAMCKRNNGVFAVKIIDRKQAKEQRLKSEVALMGTVDHPNCVRLWDVFQDKDTLCLVLDLLTGGTVLDRILELASFTEQQAASVMADVLNALHYLHNIGITHRDLKPENLLYVTSDPSSPHYNLIKLVDFGLAKLQSSSSNLSTVCGTPYFIAPEILEEEHVTYGSEVDIWSLGVLLYFMICGFHPFDDAKYPVMFSNIKKGRYSFPSPFWDDISIACKHYISKSLVVDPSQRPTAAECMEHPWIKNAGEASASKLHPSHRSFLLIQKLLIFQRIDPTCLQQVSKRLKVERIPPGELVIKAGEEGDSMYFINSGSVSVLVDGVEIDRKGIGGFFGEAALVLKQARIADVRSCGAKVYKDHGLPEAAELFRLHRDDFHAVCEMYPELKSRLSTIAEQNVHRVEKARGSSKFMEMKREVDRMSMLSSDTANRSGIEMLEKLRLQKEAGRVAKGGADSPDAVAQAQASAAVKQAEEAMGSAMELVESVDMAEKSNGEGA